jgi:hypothetical protein
VVGRKPNQKPTSEVNNMMGIPIHQAAVGQECPTSMSGVE